MIAKKFNIVSDCDSFETVFFDQRFRDCCFSGTKFSGKTYFINILKFEQYKSPFFFFYCIDYIPKKAIGLKISP